MKTVILLPYFGKFNNYFELWLNSCRENSDFDWLIFSDVDLCSALPKNVKIVHCTLRDLREKFQKKLGMPLVLKNAYKLCDYKQFYGYLFSEYLQGYDYWGYCDCDLIFGNIRGFLSRNLQAEYDKLFRTGHFSLIRNDPKLNELFFKYGTYKITLTSPVIYGYDESITGYHLGFAGELIENGYTFGDFAEWIADIDFRHYPFYEISNMGVPCVFLYENGRVYRLRKEENVIKKQERMYVHLQKRKMDVDPDIDLNKFLICPNRFCKYSDEILESEEFWKNALQEQDDYFDVRREKRMNHVRDIKRLLHEPHKLSCILYRLKGHSL